MRDVCVTPRQRLPVHSQRLTIESLGAGIVLLCTVDPSEFMEAGRKVGMIRGIQSTVYGDRFEQAGLGFIGGAPCLQQARETAQHPAHAGMSFSVDLPVDLKRLTQERFGLRNLAAGSQERAEVVEAFGNPGMLGPESATAYF